MISLQFHYCSAFRGSSSLEPEFKPHWRSEDTRGRDRKFASHLPCVLIFKVIIVILSLIRCLLGIRRIEFHITYAAA
ncbi:hypothetical protein BDV36DRAFT_253783, partial [Aspergillus pseudocaelatus]